MGETLRSNTCSLMIAQIIHEETPSHVNLSTVSFLKCKEHGEEAHVFGHVCDMWNRPLHGGRVVRQCNYRAEDLCGCIHLSWNRGCTIWFDNVDCDYENVSVCALIYHLWCFETKSRTQNELVRVVTVSGTNLIWWFVFSHLQRAGSIFDKNIASSFLQYVFKLKMRSQSVQWITYLSKYINVVQSEHTTTERCKIKYAIYIHNEPRIFPNVQVVLSNVATTINSSTSGA